MPTPFHQLPPRTAWRDIFLAGQTLTRADGTPCLQPPAVVTEDPDKLLRRMRRNGEMKMAGQTTPKRSVATQFKKKTE